MRRMVYSPILATLAVPGLLSMMSIDTFAAAIPVRTANSRARQADPNAQPTPIPPAPAPEPFSDPPPAPVPKTQGGQPAPLTNGQISPTPIPSPPAPAPARAPAPESAPEPPDGIIYSRPFGSSPERVVPPKEFLGDPDGQGSYHSPTDAKPPTNRPLPGLDPNAPLSATDRFGIAPPPGTLGHTYHRRSRLLDVKKHPRVGIVEVHLSENYDVSAIGLKSKWTGKYWELESDPLLPGIPHIFEVKAEWGPAGARKKEVRTIRLVMGRAVDLDF